MKAYIVYNKVFSAYFKTKELAEKWCYAVGLSTASNYPSIEEIDILEEL